MAVALQLKRICGLSSASCTIITSGFRVGRFASSSAEATPEEEEPHKHHTASGTSADDTSCPEDFRALFPDFLPQHVFQWRNPITEKLQRMDMLKRRLQIDIPEFYVGSIVSVTCSDKYSKTGTNTFLGICIDRGKTGLRHHFTLRNNIDGQGVEVRYEMYNPSVRKIEVLKLEKRLDDQLYYLRDAEPEFSTFPFDMAPVPHQTGSPVPLNPLKVRLRPPPWNQRWQWKDIQGVEGLWDLMSPLHKQKYWRKQTTLEEEMERFDMVRDYRVSIPREDEETAWEEMVEFEKENVDPTRSRRRFLFRRRPHTHHKDS